MDDKRGSGTGKAPELRDVCAECGAEDTLWPYFIGRRRAYKCSACGKLSKGVTRSAYEAENQAPDFFTAFIEALSRAVENMPESRAGKV